MYDDNGEIVSEVVLKDRIHMASEGIFVVILTIQKGSGTLMTSPDIISRGFIYLRDSEELMGLIRQYLKQKVALSFSNKHLDLDVIKKELKEEITHILYDQTRRTPIVIPVINEIGAPNNFGGINPNNSKGNRPNQQNRPNQPRQINQSIDYRQDLSRPVLPKLFQPPRRVEPDEEERGLGRDNRGF